MEPPARGESTTRGGMAELQVEEPRCRLLGCQHISMERRRVLRSSRAAPAGRGLAVPGPLLQMPPCMAVPASLAPRPPLIHPCASGQLRTPGPWGPRSSGPTPSTRTSPPGRGRAAGVVRATSPRSSIPGGVSPLVGRREGSRRTKNDGRGEVRCRVGARVGALKRGPVELDGAGSGQGLSWRERRAGMSHELPRDPRAA